MTKTFSTMKVAHQISFLNLLRKLPSLLLIKVSVSEDSLWKKVAIRQIQILLIKMTMNVMMKMKRNNQGKMWNFMSVPQHQFRNLEA